MTVPPPSEPGPQDAPAEPPAVQPAPRLAAPWTGVLLAIGGILTVVSTFLEYEKLTIDGGSFSLTGFGSATSTGTFDQAFRVMAGSAGKIIFGLSIVAVVLGLLIAVRLGRIGVGIAGVVVGAIGVLFLIGALNAASGDADSLSRSGTAVDGSIGIGAVLGLVGMIVTLVAAVLAVLVRRRAGLTSA